MIIRTAASDFSLKEEIRKEFQYEEERRKEEYENGL